MFERIKKKSTRMQTICNIGEEYFTMNYLITNNILCDVVNCIR